MTAAGQERVEDMPYEEQRGLQNLEERVAHEQARFKQDRDAKGRKDAERFAFCDPRAAWQIEVCAAWQSRHLQTGAGLLLQWYRRSGNACAALLSFTASCHSVVLTGMLLASAWSCALEPLTPAEVVAFIDHC